jgi:hypothetical protein
LKRRHGHTIAQQTCQIHLFLKSIIHRGLNKTFSTFVLVFYLNKWAFQVILELDFGLAVETMEGAIEGKKKEP